MDRLHPGQFPLDRGDDYVFYTGEYVGHNIIIAIFPTGQKYGTNSVAALVNQIKKFFPNL